MQNRKVTAVVLDMDGLMLDTEPLYKHAMQKTAEELGYPLTDDFMARLVGRPESDCRKIFTSYLGDDFPLDTFWEGWPRMWREMAVSEGIEQKPGLQELLSYLSEKRFPVAIATSTYREQAEFTLKSAGVTYPFEHIVTGDEVAHGKPSPDIYLEAARRLGVDSPHCVALEDSENGIRSASSAGMITIMVPDLIKPEEKVRTLANCVVDSLHEAREVIAGIKNTFETR